MADKYALIVAIANYDHPKIPRLPACDDDALSAVSWLRDNGVKDENIFLHTSPAMTVPRPVGPGASGKPLPPLIGTDASYPSVLRTLRTLAEGNGDQLFMFFSGHGMYANDQGPLFLLQNYGVDNETRHNLKLSDYLDWFQSWNYRDQFIFYDACQVPTSSIGQISSVVAGGAPVSKGTYQILPGTGVTICYSADAGQRAWAGEDTSPDKDGSQFEGGVLIKQILGEFKDLQSDAFAPSPVQLSAVKYSWQTGERWVDLRALFEDVVGPVIQELAKDETGQTPFCDTFGRARTEAKSLIFPLPVPPLVKLNVAVNPTEHVGEVAAVTLNLLNYMTPLHLPESKQTFSNPTSCVVPAGAPLTASCNLKRGSVFRVKQSPVLETFAANPSQLAFELDIPPPPIDTDKGRADEVNIRVAESGAFAPILHGQYQTIAKKNGIDMITLPGGISFEENEVGPDIKFESGVAGAENEADALGQVWLNAIRKHVVGQGFDVLLSPIGTFDLKVSPNLRFVFSDAGAIGLGGYLIDEPTVTLKPFDASQKALTRSLRDIENHPAEWIAPGSYHVSIELPWGKWISVLEVPSGDPGAVCELPSTIGRPPLRNTQLCRSQGIPVAPQEITIGRSKGGSPVTARGGVLYGIEHPPFQNLDLALARTLSGEIRVEPLSPVHFPEWDQIFSAQRLQKISGWRLSVLMKQLERQTHPRDGASKDIRNLMLLGLAYGAQANSDWDTLENILRSGTVEISMTMDFRILRASHEIARPPKEPRANLASLVNDYNAGFSPVLVWGESLLEKMAKDSGLDLFSHARPRSFSAWTGDFSEIGYLMLDGTIMKAEPISVARRDDDDDFQLAAEGPDE